MSAATLGRYTIIRELARSNDIVYEAMDPQGRKIALKELQMPANLAGQARRDRIERFRREARAAHSLKHANVVRIHDFGEADGRHYIAMEFLEGQSLRDVLRQRKVLPLNEALRIGAAVADGLQFAHQHQVVHRDVKPDNVHLEPDGRVVITDFGIARITTDMSLTADGQIFGTPSYMSPEQVTGKDIDARSDIFSLGVMLYEMVSGRKPFTGDSVVTVTYNIMNQDPSPTGASPNLERVIRFALSKDRALRYRSAAELAEDLRLVANNKPPRHAPAQLPGRSVMAPPSAPPSQPRTAAPPRAAAPPPTSRPAGPPRTAAPPPAGPPMMAPAAAAPGAGYAAPPAGYPAARPAGPPGVPAAAPAYHPPAGYAPPGYAPPGYAPPAGPVRPQSGFDLKWLLGGLALTVVFGVLIVGMIWAAVTATDKNKQKQIAVVSAANREKAVQLSNEAFLLLTSQENQRRNGQPVDTVAIAKARGLAEKALTFRTDFPPAMFNLGRALALQGGDNTDKALALFDAVIARPKEGDLPKEDRDEAAKRAVDAQLWKVMTLYYDGVYQKKLGNNELAKRRLTGTVNEADYCINLVSSTDQKNSVITYKNLATHELDKLTATTTNDPASNPGLGNTAPAVGDNPLPPTPNMISGAPGTSQVSPVTQPPANPSSGLTPSKSPNQADAPYIPGKDWDPRATGDNFSKSPLPGANGNK